MRRVLTLAFLLSVVANVATVAAADEKKEPPKLPPLDAKEWTPMKGVDGLKFWDVKEGKGEAATSDAAVTIHYTGWLTSGKVFDSSVPRGKPNTFPLASLITGWQKGIPGMKPGGVRRLMIPSELGYGKDGSPPDIPGGATLIFEIELFRATQFPGTDSKEWKPLKGTETIKLWDVVEGKGDACPTGATVTIHYTGWLTNGKKFDSSVDRGEPATFPLGKLIKGWQLGVPGMKPGGVRRLMIPYEFAYGEAGRPPKIPEKATLVFEIEFIEVAK